MLAPLARGSSMTATDSASTAKPRTILPRNRRATAHEVAIRPAAIHFPQREATSFARPSCMDLQSTPTLRNLYPLPWNHMHRAMHRIG